MKFYSNTILAPLNKNEIRNLTSVVSETLPAKQNKAPKKIFTAAELWMINKRRRERPMRRFF